MQMQIIIIEMQIQILTIITFLHSPPGLGPGPRPPGSVYLVTSLSIYMFYVCSIKTKYPLNSYL